MQYNVTLHVLSNASFSEMFTERRSFPSRVSAFSFFRCLPGNNKSRYRNQNMEKVGRGDLRVEGGAERRGEEFAVCLEGSMHRV